MNTKQNLFSAAFIICFLGAPAFAANEVIPLRPLDLPTITKWVGPDRLPAGYEDATVLVSFTLKTTGEPANLRLVSPRDAQLEKCLLPALAQCRFHPVVKDGVAVDTKVMLPIILHRFEEDARAPLQIGAIQAAAPAHPLAAADENNHPAMFHLNAVKRDGRNVVFDGTAQSVVRDSLGRPEKLSANVWAYAQFSGQSEQADRHGCDTLLVSFENEQVSALALINDWAKARVIEQLKFNPSYVQSRLADLHQATALVTK